MPLKFKSTFPRTIFADKNCLYDQLQHIQSELKEVEEAYLTEPVERVAEELVDLYISIETAFHIIEDQYIQIGPVMEKVLEKNLRRGYYP